MIEILKQIFAYLTGLKQENEKLKQELADIEALVNQIYEATQNEVYRET